MIFDGIEKEYLTVLRGRNRPAWAPVERELITVTGMAGAHLSHSKRQVRVITVPVFLMADSFSDLQKIKEDLAGWLIHGEPKELVFKDEPDRTYYAVVDGDLDLDELVRWGEGEIRFVCPDPYKYGPEKTLNFPADIVTVNNEGTAEADPVFEMIAREKATFAMISNGDDEYNLIGTPADDDVEVVDTRTSVLYENGSTIDEWSSVTSMEMVSHDPNISSVDGLMGTDGAGFRADDYGTPGNSQRGPAVFKELPDAIQDFEVVSSFDIISRREIENFRMMIYLLDENMNNVGHIGVKDNSRNYRRRVPLSQTGQHNRGASLLGDSSPLNNNARESTLMYLRFKREGQRFTAYIAEWLNQKHDIVWEGTYNDINNEFQGKVKYITLFIGSYQDRVTPYRARMNNVELFELTQATVDQTPYILYPGDSVMLDHKNDDILVNGEPRNDLKNFGGSFFRLKKGENQLIVTPEDSFDTKVTLRDKYL